MPSGNPPPDYVHAVSQVRYVMFLSCLLPFQSLARNHGDLDKPTFQIVSEMFPIFFDRFRNVPKVFRPQLRDGRWHEHTSIRGRGRCILSGRRSRRRRSTVSLLHGDALEPLELLICASFQPVLEFFASLLCHLLLLKFFRSPALQLEEI